MAFYDAIPASDGTTNVGLANAEFKVYELTDTARANPLPLRTAAGMNAAPLVTTAQGVVPPVNVVSPNYEHIFKSGEWEWQRPSTEGMRKAAEEARAAAVEAASEAIKPADQAVDEGIDRADIPGTIAREVAGQPTVTAAAEVAAKNAISMADMLIGEDRRAPVPLEAGTGWAIPFTDAAGRVVGGFTDRGQFRVAQPVDAPVHTASRTQVACIGDSLAYGYQTVGADGTPDTWAGHLAKAFPGVEFVNSGYPGSTVDDVRFRIGALPLYAEIDGGVIPASGPVKAIVKQKFGFGPGHENSYFGTLAGIPGSLICDADGKTWRFERAAAGTSVTVQGKQRLVREDFYPTHTALFWFGRNDVTFKATGFEGDVVKHVVSSIQGAVDHLRPHEKQFGIASIVNQSREVRGTENYRLITAINDALAERFPSNFIDIRTYLVNQGIYDAGLTPTAADLDAMSKDAPPPQIMDSTSHPLVFMIPHIAKKFADFLNEKAYV